MHRSNYLPLIVSLMASAEKAKVMNNEKTSSVDLEINEIRKEECVIINVIYKSRTRDCILMFAVTYLKNHDFIIILCNSAILYQLWGMRNREHTEL